MQAHRLPNAFAVTVCCRALLARGMAALVNSVIESSNDIDVNKIVIDVIFQSTPF
jgi:hypothetical protein